MSRNAVSCTTPPTATRMMPWRSTTNNRLVSPGGAVTKIGCETGLAAESVYAGTSAPMAPAGAAGTSSANKVSRTSRLTVMTYKRNEAAEAAPFDLESVPSFLDRDLPRPRLLRVHRLVPEEADEHLKRLRMQTRRDPERHGRRVGAVGLQTHTAVRDRL